MAEETEQPEAAEETSPGSSKMKKIVLIVVALLVIGGGGFAGKMFFGGDEPAEDEELVEDFSPVNAPAIYISLHPPLIVNIKDALGDAHFMQMTMEAMSREQNSANAVREHAAVIRNALILLFSSAVYEDVATVAGKKKLLADGLAEIQSVMKAQTGEPSVEALYFTALVIQ